MLQRTLPAGFIPPCLPTKTDRLPSGSQSSLAAVIGLCAPADRVAVASAEQDPMNHASLVIRPVALSVAGTGRPSAARLSARHCAAKIAPGSHDSDLRRPPTN